MYTAVVPITETTCPAEDRMSDIKSAHVGHHVRKGRILEVFENQECQWLSIRIRGILERLSLQSNL